MEDLEPESAERISAEFRNGSVTAVGVVAAFSLGFITAWGTNPLSWTAKDIIAVVPLIIGIGFQIWALSELLDPKSLVTTIYRRAIRHFLFGVGLVGCGVGVAVVADIIGIFFH